MVAKFNFNPILHLIELQAGVRTFTATELHSEAVEFSATPEGMAYPLPVVSAGKFVLGGGFNSDIITRVQPPWRIQPEDGTYILDIIGTVISEQVLQITYQNETVGFSEGALLTGQTSGATAWIMGHHDLGPPGTGELDVGQVLGTFLAGEAILDEGGGSADINGTPVWVDHNPIRAVASGTVTVRISAASSGVGADSASIAAAVWDYARLDALTSGSMGLLLNFIFGIVGGNTDHNSMAFDANSRATSITQITYTDNTLTVEIGRILYTATYNGAGEPTLLSRKEV